MEYQKINDGHSGGISKISSCLPTGFFEELPEVFKIAVPIVSTVISY